MLLLLVLLLACPLRAAPTPPPKLPSGGGQRQVADPPPPPPPPPAPREGVHGSAGIDDVAWLVLKRLNGRELVNASLVCRYGSNIPGWAVQA